MARDKSGEHINSTKNRRRGSQLGAIVLLLQLAVNAAVGAETPPAGDFGRFSMLQGYQLQPGAKTLRTGASQALRVALCYPQTAGADDPQPLAYVCDAIGEGEVVAPVSITDWSVNGIVGGNATLGSISGAADGATYTAPASKPTPDTVTVSARAATGGNGTILLVSNITITDKPLYTGTMRFTADAMEGQVRATDGSAQVTWILVEELPDVRTYTASGSISFNLAPVTPGADCEPVRVVDTIETSNKLVVYTSRANWNPNTYSFSLTASDTDTAALTTVCKSKGGGSFPMTFPKSLVLGVGGPCLPDINPKPVPLTDEVLLEGTFNCPVSMFSPGLDASWKFAGLKAP